MPKGIAGRRAAPKPVTAMARRLEAVRERFGVPSMRAFHARLAEGWEGDDVVSYEAVRNYHYDRAAPAAYLARVAAVFPGVRLLYLVAGEEPMLEEEEQAQQELGAISAAASSVGRAWARQVLRRAGVPDPRVPVGGESLPYWVPPLWALQQRLNLNTDQLGKVLAAPLRALGLDPARLDRSGREPLASYIVSMVPVLKALAPELEAQPQSEEE